MIPEIEKASQKYYPIFYWMPGEKLNQQGLILVLQRSTL